MITPCNEYIEFKTMCKRIFTCTLVYILCMSAVKADYRLVWEDNFNGTQLDEAHHWNIEVNGNGGGNNELQYYRRENVSVGIEPATGASCLILTAKKEVFNGKQATSGRINSMGKVAAKYGKIEARIKFPYTANGLWPAFWAMGDDYSTVGWPKCGEIDVIELGNATGIAQGTQDRYLIGACHWGPSWQNHPNYGKGSVHSESVQGDFHLFTLIWDATSVSMYVDLDKNPQAEPYYVMNIYDVSNEYSPGLYFHKPFFILFNLAVGGDFTGIHNVNSVTALANGEARMYVDFVRIYQKGDAGEEFHGPDSSGIRSLDNGSKKVYRSGTLLGVHGTDEPIELYDMAGCLVRKAPEPMVDVRGLSNGVYILKCGTLVRKVVLK